jgi:chemotaxis protein methyltransferase CheR
VEKAKILFPLATPEIRGKIAKERQTPVYKRVVTKEVALPKTDKADAYRSTPADYFQKGEYRACVDSCLSLLTQGELSNNLFSILIKSYANLGHPEEENEVLTKILSSGTATSEMYYMYASLLNERQESEPAEICLKRSIYLNHTHILSHLMLGDIYLKAGKRDLAIRHYENVLKIVHHSDENEIVPESDGLTVGRIKEFTQSLLNRL